MATIFTSSGRKFHDQASYEAYIEDLRTEGQRVKAERAARLAEIQEDADNAPRFDSIEDLFQALTARR